MSRTLVYGLGESGLAAARALAERNDPVLAADANDSEPLQKASQALPPGIEVRFGVGPEVLDAGISRVVTSPGVPPRDGVLAAAGERGVPVISEVGLGLELLGPEVTVAAVTGTNGKTTVVDMVGAILRASRVRHAVAGNSWRALCGCLDEVREAGVLVLEVSSFQLHYLPEPGFGVAALLNVRPDHLNWHASVEEYAQDKLRVFDGQGSGDLALVSAGDRVGREAAGSLLAETVVVGRSGTMAEGGRLILRGRELLAADELPFVGVHNLENALFAVEISSRLGASDDGIREGLRGYRLRAHRMEPVGEFGGVLYVDDSKATNPAAVAAALSGYARPVVLILGGSEKGTDFAEVLPPVRERCRAVVCEGEAGPRIADFLQRSGVEAEVRLVGDLSAAVEAARRAARPGDVVLLSPGCASFDQYAGYAERGEAFARLVAQGVPSRRAVGR